MKQIFFHIGFHKTGTSFLQGEIFPKLKNVNYIDLVKNKKARGEISKIYEKNLSVDEKKRLNHFLKGFNKDIIISRESLTRQPLLIHDKARKEIFEDLKEISKGLDAKIIVGIREQAGMILSVYKEYLHSGGYLNFNMFLEHMEKKKKNYLDYYNYTGTLDMLSSLFGNNKIFIYNFKELKENKKALLEKMMRFVGEKRVPEYSDNSYNKGYGKTQANIAMKLNRFFKSKQNPKGIIPIFHARSVYELSPRMFLQNRIMQRIKWKKLELSNDQKRFIKEYFEKDNQELYKKYKIKLNRGKK